MNSHSVTNPQQNRLPTPGLGASSRRTGNFSSGQAPSQKTQGHNKNHKDSRRPRLVNEDINDHLNSDVGASRQHHVRRGQTSITHLMNFMPPPLSESYRNTSAGRTLGRNRSRVGSSRHPSDKTRYIHANYRFIVRPNGNYELQAVDGNQPLDWNDILQILASSQSQDVSCPICLSRPVAPRMAKCGHIFCLPCLIRYIHSTQEDTPLPEKKVRWGRCPICWDSIQLLETKPVRWYTGQENPSPREGDDIVLRLVMRQPGNTLALPRDGSEALCRSGNIPSYLNSEAMDYARVIMGSEAYMIQYHDNEIEELAHLENEDILMYGEEPKWTRKAVIAVNESKGNLKDIGEIIANIKEQNQNQSRTKIQAEKCHPASNEDVTAQLRPRSPKINSNRDDIGESTWVQYERTKDQDEDHRKRSQPDPPYLFYQALPHYYLAPLDIRILKSAFGSFEMFPLALLPRVECINTEHMHAELRKRAKYISHLPNGCEVKFLECNWDGILPLETLEQFKGEIERRRKRNFEKKKREERDRINAEMAQEEEKWATLGAQHSSGSTIVLNQYSYTTTQSFNTANPSSVLPALQESSSVLPTSSSIESNSIRTVWGTTLVNVPSTEEPDKLNEEINDGWLNSRDIDVFAENELIARAESLSLAEDNTEVRHASGNVQTKKKKAKKITLMSTSARRTA
ncbi:hypothetical protein K3495_g11180 [Podosphaera aphanis]|nr:hypothetical protein K3495_g11180 [Podosphaera aphanis]